MRKTTQYEPDNFYECDTLDEAMNKAKLLDPSLWCDVSVYETPVELDIRAYFDAQEGRVVKFWVCDGSVTVTKQNARCTPVYEKE